MDKSLGFGQNSGAGPGSTGIGAKICLITGGCRSGKSSHAQRLAEKAGQKRLFIATAPVLDNEMRRRVSRHQATRRGLGWETWEEERDLAGCFQRAGEQGKYDIVLCDCLTLWVNNLLHAALQNGVMPEEEEMAEHAREVCAIARDIPAKVFFVTNEVGQGIVPADAVSRRFRDLAGRCNQEVAASADSVILMVSGLPVVIFPREGI
ncbi:MAG: adenosylcobinamide kinase /adenosylcobinamide-phosphate guanylyltransferase [Candidatus Kentron sp. G]|nr:MAG: adenosylcobinamide kinase /adenosylcobinamide-phosphate guanylyltransferase [Candidatus Kentron sp. G]VFM98810.1 MAG: adenosylcobinamide kinase /adenosylcobinamide-phosphate guanylyltransferase [Candidatus Kentron sp. G]VFM98929.1 MAG: adenosylcobinamide kinase /adenosylcobinamide-phosphate guanylyltransferase [Candidatus Kentron sp. G]